MKSLNFFASIALKIFVKIGGQYYKCTGNKPELNINSVETDSLSFVIISNEKGRRTEFVKDSLAAVAISTAEPRHIHAIERIDIYNNGILLNDSSDVNANSENLTQGSLTPSLIANYKSQIYNKLTDKILKINNND